jgi:hypothetical protein
MIKIASPMVFQKCKKFSYVIKKYNLAKEILLEYDGQIDLEKSLIDYKIHELREGEMPSRYLWHYDGHNDAVYTEPSKYAIFISEICGDSKSRTCFFENEPSKLKGSEKIIHQVSEELSKFKSLRYAEENKWYHYTSHNLHTAVPAKGNGVRAILRIKEVLK